MRWEEGLRFEGSWWEWASISWFGEVWFLMLVDWWVETVSRWVIPTDSVWFRWRINVKWWWYCWVLVDVWTLYFLTTVWQDSHPRIMIKNSTLWRLLLFHKPKKKKTLINFRWSPQHHFHLLWNSYPSSPPTLDDTLVKKNKHATCPNSRGDLMAYILNCLIQFAIQDWVS